MISGYIAILFVVLVFIDATGDAFKSIIRHNNKLMNKSIKFFSWFSEDLLLFFSILVYPLLLTFTYLSIKSVLLYALGYMLIRASLFNLIYNLWMGYKWWFFGTQKYTDKALDWLCHKSLFARKFGPRESSVILALSVFSFLFGLVSIGFFELFN